MAEGALQHLQQLMYIPWAELLSHLSCLVHVERRWGSVTIHDQWGKPQTGQILSIDWIAFGR